MKNLKLFFQYFDKNKKLFIGYSLFSFIAGLFELCGVALVYPFIIGLLEHKTYYNLSPLIIGILIILLFLFKNGLMIFYYYVQAKLTKKIEEEAKLKFMQYFLSMPYQETSKISLAEKSNIMGFLVPNIINNYILRLQNLSVNMFIFILLSGLLVIKFPIAMLATVISACLLVYVQNSFFIQKLQKITNKYNTASREYNQRTNEALINLKGVKASNNEVFFFNNYQYANSQFNKYAAKTQFLNSIPPYITEPVIIILLFILLAIISCQLQNEPQKLIASFALIVSAIFRLAPTISRIQVNLNGINSVKPLLVKLFDFCNKFSIDKIPQIQQKEFAKFENLIEFKNISFEYQYNKPILKDINFEIKKGEFVGISGLSGNGKTTLVDIIAGLLIPKNGQIIIDGTIQNRPLKIGYITQEITMIEGSIKNNVTYGEPICDENKIIDVLKKAQLYDFIIQNYQEGINANPFIDSTGFSQGQKQRLAIARALYSEPDILILDEATSSLDLKTEDEICNVLNALKGEKTIIAIAHRLSTIKNADKILFLKNGRVENSGTFEELYTQNNEFKELVDLSSVK